MLSHAKNSQYNGLIIHNKTQNKKHAHLFTNTRYVTCDGGT